MLKKSTYSRFARIWLLLLPVIALSACAYGEHETQAAEFPTPTLTQPPPSEEPQVESTDPFEGVDLAIMGVDGNILLADIDTETVVNLTEDARLDPLGDESFSAYGEPTWSPSGEELAYIRSVRPQGEDLDVDVLVAGKGMETIQIEADTERPFYLYWSPGGDKISFLASKPGDPITLWIKDLTDQGGQLDQGQPYYWDWAPDGSRLFAHVGGSVSINPDGAYLSFISPEEIRQDLDLAPLAFQAPAYSPDGERILISSRVRIGSDSLLLVDAEGSILQEIVPVEGRASFAWSNDGTHFATAVGPDLGAVHVGVLSLFELEESGIAELKLNIADNVIAFWWSPDGRKIAYFQPVLSPPDLTQPVALNAQQEEELFLQLHVFDVASGQSTRLTTLRPTSEFFRILPYYDQYQRSATIWSPESTMITYPSIGDGGVGQIFVIEVEGNDLPRRITSGEMAYWTTGRP